MPAQTPVPTIQDFRDAASRALRGRRDFRLSSRSGGGYDLIHGSSAIVWSRQATRDRDLFRAIYAETARGADLERILEANYGVSPIEATHGRGTAILTRPTAAAGAGTIYVGTRVVKKVLGSPPAEYRVRTQKDVGAADLVVAVEVEAVRSGTGVAISATTGLLVDDILFDATLSPVSLMCADGTDREKDEDYLARARAGRRDGRVGHLTRIVSACVDAGAANVVALHAGYFGAALDIGLSHIYVGDDSFTTPSGLIEDCVSALEPVRVLGCDVQWLTMQRKSTTAAVSATLNVDPNDAPQAALRGAIASVLVDYLEGRRDWWTFRYDEMNSRLMAISEDIAFTTVSFRETGAPAAIAEPAAAFPTIVTRYTLAPTDVSVTFLPPG